MPTFVLYRDGVEVERLRRRTRRRPTSGPPLSRLVEGGE